MKLETVANDAPSVLDRVTRFGRLLARKPFWTYPLFLLLTLAVYSPCLDGGFVWDDQYLVKENPFFRSPVFITEVFQHHLFHNSYSLYYRPVQNISYMLDYWLWDRNSFGYHLTNVFLHATAAFLLLLLLKRILPAIVERLEPGNSRRSSEQRMTSDTTDLAALAVE